MRRTFRHRRLASPYRATINACHIRCPTCFLQCNQYQSARTFHRYLRQRLHLVRPRRRRPMLLMKRLLPCRARCISCRPLTPIRIILKGRFYLFTASRRRVVFEIYVPVLPFGLCRNHLFMTSSRVHIVIHCILSKGRRLPSCGGMNIVRVILIRRSMPTWHPSRPIVKYDRPLIRRSFLFYTLIYRDFVFF